MDSFEILLGLLVTVGTLVATAVWVVSRIDKTTAVLGTKIENLTSSVNRLHTTADKLGNRADDHQVRIAVLESRVPQPEIITQPINPNG